MTARRITIGMKPGMPGIEAPDSPPDETTNGAGGSHQHAAGRIEEFVNGGHEPPAHATADAWVKRGGETPREVTATREVAATPLSGTSPILTAGAGAALGAVVAVVAVLLLLPKVTPSVDARIAPVADRLAAVELRQQQTEVGLGRLNNEIAQAIEADGTAATKIEEQAAALAEFEKLIASQSQAGGPSGSDENLTVFAVAVGQLRAAFYDGRPFEAELVSVFALAGKEEALLQPLKQLSAPARAGVASAEALRGQFAAAVAAAGLTLGEPQGYYDYGMSMVNQYIGYSGKPYAVEIGNVAVTDADGKLAVGDVAGAIALVKGLDPAVLMAFQPWLDGAGAYVRAEAAVAELTKTVVDRLRLSMGADRAG